MFISNQQSKHRSRQSKTHSNVRWVELSSVKIVHDLVGGEESHCVGIILEPLNDTKDSRQQGIGVRCPRLSAVDAGLWRINVKEHVDTSRVEDACALIVVCFRVHVVDADRVDLCYC